jgi:hypothetical protein
MKHLQLLETLVLMFAILGVGCLHWYWSTRVPTYYTYKVEAFLTYLESPENTPLERLWIRFPVPTVNGEWKGQRQGKWVLYWQDENGLHLQASQEKGVIKLRPPRNSDPQIKGGADLYSPYAPKALFLVDRLYPGEVFEGIIWTERVESKYVSLREAGRTEALAVFALDNGDVLPAKVTISVTLWGRRKENLQLLENFYGEADHTGEVWLKKMGPCENL